MREKKLENLRRYASAFTPVLAFFASLCIIGYMLANPYGGFIFSMGASMEPVYPSGCGIIELNDWDENSSLENKIVLYKPKYLDTEADIFGNEIEFDYYYVHRVVEEYRNYSHNKTDYRVTEQGNFHYTENYSHLTYYNIDQPYSDMEKLEGERVIITKGDNNLAPDPEIINANRVEGISDPDFYIELPC